MKQDKSNNTLKINDKKTINGWAFFDWANSAYALVITAAIFPAYYLAVTTQSPSFLGNILQGTVFYDNYEKMLSHVTFLGVDISNTALYAYSISFAYLVIALISPLLSGIADFGGKKMFFMRFFTVIGAAACVALYYFKTVEDLYLGTIAFIIATIGFAGGIVFYNAFLPDIVTEDHFDRVSAKGFVYGYIGSVLLLIVNLLMILQPDWFGITHDSMGPRISFVMVGFWWFGFAQITFRRLPNDPKGRLSREHIYLGLDGIKSVWKKLKTQTNIKYFLMAYFFYNAGVQTVLFLASTFAKVELKFGTQDLIIIVLVLQIVAIFGAYLFAKMSQFKGNKFTIFIILAIWIGICVFAYAVHSKIEFYIISAFVGMVMGGIQSISRSTYTKIIPEDTGENTSYFSFYDVLLKVSTVVGTFLFGFIDWWLGGMRNSILALALLFIIGAILMVRVQVKRIL